MNRSRPSQRAAQPLRAGARDAQPPKRTPLSSGADVAPRGAAEAAADLVLLGEIGRPHGLKGAVRLKSFTAAPEAIGRYGPLVTPDGRSVTITALRAAGAAPDLLIARLDGITSRGQAESLTGQRLYAPRQQLGLLDEDEFFAADLIGLAVEDAAGKPLGTVAAVPDYGAGPLLEIAAAATTVLVPFRETFVPVVDLAARRVVVDAPDL